MLIFCVVLFFYLHIFFHLKTSEDLEIYEITDTSKERFDEICNLRQPILFYYKNKLDEFTETNMLNNFSAFDVRIRNTKEVNEDTVSLLPVILKKAIKLLDDDKDSKYISENNGEFLEETSFSIFRNS